MTDPFDVSRETILITGASQGLGRQFARVLSARGAAVVLAARQTAKLKSLEDEIRAAGGNAQKVAANLRNADGPHALAKQVRAVVGHRLDILVANAGVSKAVSIEETTVEDFDDLFAVNVRAPYFLVQQLLPVMCKGSSVIFMSSLVARTRYPV